MGGRDAMINDLGFVALPVEDVSRAAEWYVTQLDLMIVRQTDDSVTLAGPNGYAVEFRKGDALARPEGFVLGFATEDFDALYGQMHEKGMTLVGGPETRDGRRVLKLTDRSGYTVELFELAEGNLAEELTIDRNQEG